MPRHTKLAAGRKDVYYHMAKETGYRSRAAFKLLQLNKKYDFLSGAHCLLDLCAAPGGWSQVAIQNMPVNSLVIAVDLDPIKHIPGLQAFQSDITSQHCRNELKKLINNTPVDVVVHDGAPNVTGDYSLDSYGQNVLVLWALKLASEFLKQGGTFVSKIFRSGEHMQLLYVLKQLFETAELTKPDSSRETSAEIFVVCRGFKGQFAEIDQKMFDPEIVLSHNDEKEQSLKALVKTLDYNVRHRRGYDVDLNRRVIDSVEFVLSEQPIEILSRTHSILFDFDLDNDHRLKTRKDNVEKGISFNQRKIENIDEYYRIRDILRGSAEQTFIDSLQDIKQLSKPLLQKVLAWHRKMYGAVCQAVPVMAEAEAKDINQHTKTVDELVQEQEQAILKQKHDEQRKLIQEQKKQQLKQLKKFENFDRTAIDQVAIEEQRANLFQITQIGDEFLQNTDVNIQESEKESESEDSTVVVISKEKVQKFIYDEADQDKYFQSLDADMNQYYDEYTSRLKRQMAKDQERNQQEMVSRGIPKNVTDMWFGQSEFKKKTKDTEEDEFADQFPLPRDLLRKTKAHEERVKALRAKAREDAKDNRQLERMREEHKGAVSKIQIVDNDNSKKESELVRQGFGKVVHDEIKDIEIVHESEDEKYYYDDEDDEDDMIEEEEEQEEEPAPEQDDKVADQPAAAGPSLSKLTNKENIEGTAIKMALASKFLRKKGRAALEDSAYGKRFYAGEDDEYDLPAWFVQDELDNCQPQRPITAEDVAEMKEALKDINSMPRTKKEREAVARKKMHAHQRLSQAQEKTQEIINREDLSEREKIKKLKLLQQGVEKKPRLAKIVYSNLHKGQAQYQGKTGRNIKFVDRRMKKEMKAEKEREKKYGKKQILKNRK